MKEIYFFYSDTAVKILEASKQGLSCLDLSLDLNLSSDRILLESNLVRLDKKTTLDLSALSKVAETPGKIFILKDNSLSAAEVRAEGYLKLVPTQSAPTLEINGIKMHRSKDIDPLTDARLKTREVVQSNDLVLDTCGGLGYSAMFALKAGAKKVISTEKNHAVLRLRRLNPWLETDDRLELLHADINRKITEFEDLLFDSILHDPPRFSSATGDLYGKPFYTQLYRVMKPGGRLFHYTGSPKRVKEKEGFLTNTEKRLDQTGFARILFHDHLQGFTAIKKTH